MAKDKSLGSNPALAFHKKAKKASINKSKAERSKLRDTQLSKRRPDQVQRQIDELRQLSQSGKINAQDRKNLESLERDLARINKLRTEGKTGPVVTSERTKLRDEKEERRRDRIPKDPTRSYYYDPVYNPYGVPPPGMPYREVDPEAQDSDSSTTSSVARIPLPPGTPPPLDVEQLTDGNHVTHNRSSSTTKDEKPRIRAEKGPGRMAQGTVAATEPQDTEPTMAAVPVAPAQTTYSAAPVTRDLHKAAAAFVPKNLKRKAQERTKPAQIDPLDLEAVEEDQFARQQEANAKGELVDKREPVRKRLNLAPAVP